MSTELDHLNLELIARVAVMPLAAGLPPAPRASGRGSPVSVAMRRAVLIAMATRADKKGRVAISVTAVAKLAGCSDNTVRDVLAKAESDGIIIRDGKKSCRGGYVVRWCFTSPNRECVVCGCTVRGVAEACSRACAKERQRDLIRRGRLAEELEAIASHGGKRNVDY